MHYMYNYMCSMYTILANLVESYGFNVLVFDVEEYSFGNFFFTMLSLVIEYCIHTSYYVSYSMLPRGTISMASLPWGGGDHKWKLNGKWLYV